MKLKKLLPLILVLCMMIAILVACDSSENRSPAENGQHSETESTEPEGTDTKKDTPDDSKTDDSKTDDPNKDGPTTGNETTKKFYTVTWKNYDGTILEIDENVEHGTMPSYDGAEPKKASTAQFTYAFIGWAPNVDAVSGDITYTAQFSSTTNSYTVTWKNYDGSLLEMDENILYGMMPSYNGITPTKEATVQFTYTFIGWTPNVSAVSGDITYTAQFSSTTNAYTVTWKNHDGTTLETDENVTYGTMPSYDSAEPTKEETEKFTYTFIGWSPNVSAVSGDITYTAQFSSKINIYTVIWKNYDGTILETDENVVYGTSMTYDGSVPLKAPTEEFFYTFEEWTATADVANKVIIITATYKENPFFEYVETRDGYSIDAYYGDSARVVFPTQYQGKDIVEIGEYVLFGNDKVLEVVLPNTVKTIGEGAFSNCSRLYKINIPTQCQTIGHFVMANTDIEEITLPASVSNIGQLWLYNAPITKIRFEGTPDRFVGEYFGILTGKLDLSTSANKLEDHFNRDQQDSTEQIKISIGGGRYSYVSKYSYIRWTLKNDNRWFETSFNNPYTMTRDTVKMFANGQNSDYSYSEILSRTETKDSGAKVYHYTYTYMQGAFALLPPTLETIEISRNAEVDESVLLGYASFLTISYYD